VTPRRGWAGSRGRYSIGEHRESIADRLEVMRDGFAIARDDFALRGARRELIACRNR